MPAWQTKALSANPSLTKKEKKKAEFSPLSKKYIIA
jgi:hypothetical protein